MFYPLYQYPLADAPAPEEQQAADDNAPAETDSQALRDAYNRGAQDALAQQQQGRYGQHYLDSRAHSTQQTDAKKTAAAPVESAQDARAAPEDDSPPTVFIFKDGHKLQTRNFAIMDQTLFDFSSKPLKKIQLSDLDVDATRKANDDLGNPLRL